jgi:hypothetical protein
VVSFLLCSGIAYAATRDITTRLGGKVKDVFKITGTVLVNALKVNGIVQIKGSVSNPSGDLRLADNVRIDGSMYRGTKTGTSDNQPLKVNDNMEVAGSLAASTVATNALIATSLSGTGIISSGNLASGAVTSEKISDGTIATSDLASGAVTQAKEDATEATHVTTKSGTDYDIASEVQMTTGSSSLFCTFSGYGTTNAANQSIHFALILDGEISLRTYRSTTMGGGSGHTILVTSTIFSVAAGTHTVQLGWNTDTNATATMFYHTLDCLELKK